MPTYCGYGGTNRKLKNIECGNGGVVRNVSEMWTGIGGVNRKIFGKEIYSMALTGSGRFSIGTDSMDFAGVVVNGVNYAEGDGTFFFEEGTILTFYAMVGNNAMGSATISVNGTVVSSTHNGAGGSGGSMETCQYTMSIDRNITVTLKCVFLFITGYGTVNIQY